MRPARELNGYCCVTMCDGHRYIKLSEYEPLTAMLINPTQAFYEAESLYDDPIFLRLDAILDLAYISAASLPLMDDDAKCRETEQDYS